MFKKIGIFDFDGSVCISPEKKPENLAKWSERNPTRPFGGGWWGNVNSLCIETFNPQLVDHVKSDLLERIADPTCYTALLTGRIPRFSKVVKEILRKHGVPYMDAYYFNDQQSTLPFKLNKLEEIRLEFPTAEVFEMWEDREEHIPYFVEWGQQHFCSNFTLHHITDGKEN